MKIVIDTNIIFSAILNTNGTIGDLIFNSQNIFDFYSSHYMNLEINNHWERLKKISRLSDVQIEDSYLKIASLILIS